MHTQTYIYIDGAVGVGRSFSCFDSIQFGLIRFDPIRFDLRAHISRDTHHDGEGDLELVLHERADLGRRAGLLAPELVAGEGQHLEALGPVLVLEGLQLLVLGREPA